MEITLNNKKLPAQKFPLILTIPNGGSFSGGIPILQLSDDLINAVYPNNAFVSIGSGLAEVTLLGVDSNDHIVTLKFTTPLRFETDPSGFVTPETKKEDSTTT